MGMKDLVGIDCVVSLIRDSTPYLEQVFKLLSPNTEVKSI